MAFNFNPPNNNNFSPLSDNNSIGSVTDFGGVSSLFPDRKPSDFTTGAVKSIRILSCNFVEMVEQTNMGFRPFVSNVTRTDVLDNIPNIVSENRKGGQFRSENLNPYINDIIALSSNTLGNINIVNGWGIRRYSFTIMVEVMHSNGNAQNYMVEGFTDSPEISTAHERINIDPNLVMFINNIVCFSERKNQLTGSKTLIPTENFNIICKDPFDKSIPLHDLVTQRPYDITNIGVSGILAGNTSKLAYDSRTSISTTPKMSNLSNNNPSTYVAKIINDGIASIDKAHTDSIYDTTSLREMIDFTRESNINNNGFLRQLGKYQSDIPSAVTSFTWSELTQLDKALASTLCPYLNVYPLSNRGIHLPSNGNSCDNINGSGNEQVFASAIANGITDIMARCRATEVSVMATNSGGEDIADVTSMRCFDQNEVKTQAGVFELLFINNIVKMINHNTNYGYNILAQASVWGETFIKINIGYGSFTFLFPNFANSMYSPMITNQKENTNDISKHLLTIANVINEEQHRFESTSGSSLFTNSSI